MLNVVMHFYHLGFRRGGELRNEGLWFRAKQLGLVREIMRTRFKVGTSLLGGFGVAVSSFVFCLHKLMTESACC